MDFNLDQALNEVFDTVRSGGVARGVTRLLLYCRKEDPDSKEWDELEKLPFEEDARLIAAEIERAFGSRRINEHYRGVYFGLDGLNMPSGKEIEFGCSTEYDPDVDPAQWAVECNLYIRTVKSKALRAAYRIVEGAGIGDYVVCLGYTGLALRAAFEEIEPKILLGKTKSRGVCWGFHDGDLFNLGIITPKGFKLNLPESEPALPFLPVQPSQASMPVKIGAARWIQLAEEFASQSPSLPERARALASVAECYCESREYESAQECLADIADLMKSGSEFKGDSLFKMRMKQIYYATKKLSDTIAKPFIPEVLFTPDDDSPIEDPVDKQRVESAVKNALAAANKGTMTASKQVQDAISELISWTSDAIRRRAAREAFRKLFEALVGLGGVKEALALAKKVDIGDDFIEILWRSNHIPEYRAALRERFPLAAARESDLMNGHHAIRTYKRCADLQARLKDTDGIKQTLKSAGEFANLVFGYKHASFWVKACVSGAVALIARGAGNARKSDALLAEAEKYAELQSRSKDARDNATTAWLSVTDDYAEAGLLDDAIRSARRIPGRETKRQKVGSLLAQTGREGEAEALLSECKTPKTKVDLALWIARHLIRVKENEGN